ncbi:MAG: hypothetical protein G3W71_22580, partial [Xanthomonas perforans]|nr:hypothetical protein [Xanthomonas perforans]
MQLQQLAHPVRIEAELVVAWHFLTAGTPPGLIQILQLDSIPLKLTGAANRQREP